MWLLVEWLLIHEPDLLIGAREDRATRPYQIVTQAEVSTYEECVRKGEANWYEMHGRLDGVASGRYDCLPPSNLSLTYSGPR
jgi:hypothetical protein